MNIKSVLVSKIQSMSSIGITVAIIFLSISISPSLLPRPYILQGVLSGLLLYLGYMFGLILTWLWGYFQLPVLVGKSRLMTRRAVFFICFLFLAVSLFYANYWQDNLRELMGLPSLKNSLHVHMILIAIVISMALLLLSFLIKGLLNKIKMRLKKVIPYRVANSLSLVMVAFLIFIFTNDIIIRNLVNVLDNVYALADSHSDKGIASPTESFISGSAQSKIAWHTLGSAGQTFVTSGASKKQLTHYFGHETKQPLRVYAGLRSGDSAEERAKLVLDELIRVNGFDRSKLIIATPTGTGWLDPSAMDTLEYLHKGDNTIVSMQYSYLPSWLTLLVDPSSAKRSAAVLYQVIHQYWSKLPKSSRPDLYLFGLSLGAFGAETSINLTTIIKNPIQGGLFAGAPFPSTLLPLLTKQRNKESPQWLPVIQDSSLVRFTAQENKLRNNDWHWGPMRFVYIQYASDPITFFSTDLYRKQPDWMKGERGHDVSPEFKWFPMITFFQVLFDLPMADKMPRGHSHNYSASSYIDGWLEVTSPENWGDKEIRRLKLRFSKQ